MAILGVVYWNCHVLDANGADVPLASCIKYVLLGLDVDDNWVPLPDAIKVPILADELFAPEGNTHNWKPYLIRLAWLKDKLKL